MEAPCQCGGGSTHRQRFHSAQPRCRRPGFVACRDGEIGGGPAFNGRPRSAGHLAVAAAGTYSRYRLPADAGLPAEAITFIYDGGTYDGGSLATVAGGQAEFLAADLALAGLGRPESAQLKAALDAHELLSVLELRDGQRIDTVQRDVPPRELLPDFDNTISSGS